MFSVSLASCLSCLLYLLPFVYLAFLASHDHTHTSQAEALDTDRKVERAEVLANPINGPTDPTDGPTWLFLQTMMMLLIFLFL
jgi:hypothetical protein